MSVYERVVQNMYKIVVGDQDGGATIYILNEAIARKFRANCIFSYDGKKWIKTSGGKSLTLRDVATFLKEEDLQQIKRFFNMGG